jgi:glycosyltransferase involved in cell wall biosynthesis
LNLFITNTSREAWGWKEDEAIVVEHMVEEDLFKPEPQIKRQPFILSVCNQFNRKVRWEPCGYPLWEQVIQPFNQHKLTWKHLGADCDNGLGEAAKDLQDLILHYQNALIFINTSHLSPIPMSLIEAASCGCCVISTSTCEIPHIFTNGYDSILSNDPKELREACIYMLNNPDKAEEMGKRGRETVLKRFSLEKFKSAWTSVFQKALDIC